MSQDNLMKLECSDCKNINYHSKKNRKIHKDRLELEKFCKSCGSHKTHKETR